MLMTPPPPSHQGVQLPYSQRGGKDGGAAGASTQTHVYTIANQSVAWYVCVHRLTAKTVNTFQSTEVFCSSYPISFSFFSFFFSIKSTMHCNEMQCNAMHESTTCCCSDGIPRRRRPRYCAAVAHSASIQNVQAV